MNVPINIGNFCCVLDTAYKNVTSKIGSRINSKMGGVPSSFSKFITHRIEGHENG